MFGHFHLFDGSLDYWEPNLGRGTQTLDANGWLSMNELDHTLVWVGNIMTPVFEYTLNFRGVYPPQKLTQRGCTQKESHFRNCHFPCATPLAMFPVSHLT